LQTAGVKVSQSTQLATTVVVQQTAFATFINFGSKQDWQIALVDESQEVHPETAAV
jgi:hypothetical protein